MSVPSDNSTFSSETRHLAVLHDAIVTSAHTAALAVGADGNTNPAFRVNTATTSSATGVEVTSAAAAAGASIAAISSATNEVLNIDAKGSSALRLGGTSTGGVTIVQGGLTVTAGGISVPSVSITGVTVLSSAQSGRLLTLGGAGGYAVTLPAPASGLSYRFAVRAAVTGASITIGTNAAAAIMNGVITEATDGTTAMTGDNTITVTTTAGIGSHISLESDGTLWYVTILSGVQNGITTA